jgi:hypothetical protein
MRAKHACSLARPIAGNQLQLGRCYTTGSAILAMNLRHWILRLCTCILTRAHSGCDASPQDPNCRVGKFRRRGCYVSHKMHFLTALAKSGPRWALSSLCVTAQKLHDRQFESCPKLRRRPRLLAHTLNPGAHSANGLDTAVEIGTRPVCYELMTAGLSETCAVIRNALIGSV